MRLLIDALGTRVDGAGGGRTLDVASQLSRRARRHQVAFLVRPELRDVLPGDGAVTVLTPPAARAATPARVGWQMTGLPVLARRWRADVVLSLYNVLSPWWPRSGPRTAVMISNVGPISGRPVAPHRRPREVALRRLTLRAARTADLVVVKSHFTADLLAERVARADALTLPPSLPEFPEPEPVPLLAPAAPFAVVLADLYRHKQLETPLHALARLTPDRRPHLVCVGTPRDTAYARELEALAARLGVADRVRWVGGQRNGRALGVLAAADVCVAPSGLENLSYVPLEAMELGTPLVASDIPPHREAAGDAAVYFRPGDARGLADALERVLGDAALRDRMRAAGQARIRSAADADAVGVLLAALERLASRPA